MIAACPPAGAAVSEIRVVIVEDEPPARAKLLRLLAAHPRYRVVAEAETVAAALAALRNERPDLLFLDIALGAGSGFDVLARAAPPYPLIVFTTAYHEHAVRAFEFAALDYLLKPFDRERFGRALARVEQRLAVRAGGDTDDDERLRRLGALAVPRLRRLVVHERGRAVAVPLEAVQRLSAAGNYVEIHAGARRHLLRAALSRLAQRLDPDEFVRVHRSHLVRADAIIGIEARAHGDAALTLSDGSEVLLSRRYRDLLPDDWLRSRVDRSVAE
jgi:two-component system LytT family response regulator